MSESLLPDYDPTTLVRSITVEIEAPASLVGEIVTDLDSYPLWNPLCVAVRSTL